MTTTPKPIKCTLQRVRINPQGYDSLGTYYGAGLNPLWRLERADGERFPGLFFEDSGPYVYEFRSPDRESAKARARKVYGAHLTFYR